jgi:hypothetical protein
MLSRDSVHRRLTLLTWCPPTGSKEVQTSACMPLGRPRMSILSKLVTSSLGSIEGSDAARFVPWDVAVRGPFPLCRDRSTSKSRQDRRRPAVRPQRNTTGALLRVGCFLCVKSNIGHRHAVMHCGHWPLAHGMAWHHCMHGLAYPVRTSARACMMFPCTGHWPLATAWHGITACMLGMTCTVEHAGPLASLDRLGTEPPTE